MPMAIPRLGKRPTAAVLRPAAPAIASLPTFENRGSARDRGYDTRWDQARRGYLRKHPLCCCCLANGATSAATVVDHIQPHRGDTELFWERSNWQGLCARCHNTIKRRIELAWERGEAMLSDLTLSRLLPDWFVT